MKSFKQHLDDPIEEGLLYSVNPKLANWIDRKIHKKTYKAAVRKLLSTWAKDRQRKILGGDRLGLAGQVAREYDINPRSLIKYVNDMVKAGILPKRLKLDPGVVILKGKN